MWSLAWQRSKIVNLSFQSHVEDIPRKRKLSLERWQVNMQACWPLAGPFGSSRTAFTSSGAFRSVKHSAKRPHFLGWRCTFFANPSSCAKLSTEVRISEHAHGWRCLASLGKGPQSTEGDGVSSGLADAQAEEIVQASDTDGWQWAMTLDELVAYTLLVVAVSTVPLLQGYPWVASVHFLFLAIWSVYVGSHRSLLKSPPQRMSLKQGLAVPLFSSFVLFGFYCLLRFFPDFDLRALISAYLALVGALAVANNLTEPLRLLFSRTNSPSWQFDLPRWLVQENGATIRITLTAADVLAGIVGIGVSVASKQIGASYSFNNFIAVCIVTELLQLLSLGSFSTAAALLCGLLLYDVFWVFGSSQIFGDNVMVTVATSSSFDGPMKLIFPQVKANASYGYSILGLGDIAVPGLLTALMLRFDRARSKFPQKCKESSLLQESVNAELSPKSSPDKTYFTTCVISYIVGLAITIVVNSVSGAPQPALLYLVPCLLLGVLLTASLRSESSLLLSYKDEVIGSSITVNTKDL